MFRPSGARVRCRNASVIPRVLYLTVEDRRFCVPIVVESWEKADPILLGEETDRRLGLSSLEAQEAFITQSGFNPFPSADLLGPPRAPHRRGAAGADRAGPVRGFPGGGTRGLPRGQTLLRIQTLLPRCRVRTLPPTALSPPGSCGVACPPLPACEQLEALLSSSAQPLVAPPQLAFPPLAGAQAGSGPPSSLARRPTPTAPAPPKARDRFPLTRSPPEGAGLDHPRCWAPPLPDSSTSGPG